MAEPLFPYDLNPYADAWNFPPASIDPRHLFWMFDVLCAGRFRHALEIGCLYGASSTAFVEAINRDVLDRATFCDVEPQVSFQAILQSCRYPARTTTYAGRSVDLLRYCDEQFDFVFVDGDHLLETVQEEVELLLERKPVCIMAHDTSAQSAGFPDCDGSSFLKWRLQTMAPYMCLEENALRMHELTQRGMFLATTSTEIFERARESLRSWGVFGGAIRVPSP